MMIKKSLMFVGFGSVIVIAGCSVGGWALVNKNETADQILSNSKKIIPNITNTDLIKYSPEHILKYWDNYKSDFNFMTVSGYDKRIDYNISNIVPNGLELKLEIIINVKGKEFISEKYEVTIPKLFATVEESKKNIINQTIQELPSFKDNVSLTESPKPGISVSPAQIIFEFNNSVNSEIIKDTSPGSINTFIFTKNGAKIIVSNILDMYSTEADFDQFKESYNTLIKPENIDVVMAEFINQTKNNNTIMLFSIIDESDADKLNPKGISLMKNFSGLDPSNAVENAIEFPLFLNAITPPTALEVIDSIAVENDLKYLEFFNEGNITAENEAAFSKFNYNIIKAELVEGNETHTSINVEIMISEKNNPNNNKNYFVIIEGLMSIQQEEFDKLLINGEILLKPNITDTSLTIEQIIANWQTTLEIPTSSSAKYPDFVFEIIGANISPGSSGSQYISISIKITNKIDTTFEYSYISAILNGWV